MWDFITIFILGSIAGSFLNVCIYRIPNKISIVGPFSFCPKCKARIPVWSNIPILGYILLKGQCFHCKKTISVIYPVTEFLTGILTTLVYYNVGLSSKLLVFMLFIYFLIVISFLDYKTHLIYDRILIPFLIIGFVLQIIIPFTTWPDALLGIVAGGGFMFTIAMLGNFIFKKESMGMGDVKFAMVTGFYLGWQNILIALYFGFFLAFLTILIVRGINKAKLSNLIPLGPFLSAGLVIFLLWGEQLIQFYFSIII